MEYSGEQFIPEITSKRLADEHYGRYRFVRGIAKDKNVLDIACGSGYGSFELSKVAKKVVGVDISNEAIKSAEKNYSASNLAFRQASCSDDLDYKNEFDLIVSFETIEHLEDSDRAAFFALVKKYLKQDGLFVVSTPNKLITSPFTEKPLNKYHVKEFYASELEKEIGANFKIEKIYGQRFTPNWLLLKPIRKFVRLLEIVLKKDFRFYCDRYDPELVVWEDKSKNPRIIIIISRKYE